MANSADPDQLASSEANWSGSTLFAKQGISGFSRTRVIYVSTWMLDKRAANAVLDGTWTGIEPMTEILYSSLCCIHRIEKSLKAIELSVILDLINLPFPYICQGPELHKIINLPFFYSAKVSYTRLSVYHFFILKGKRLVSW